MAISRMTEAEALQLKRGGRLIPHPDESRLLFRQYRETPGMWFEFISLAGSNFYGFPGGRCCHMQSHPPIGCRFLRGQSYNLYCARFCSPPIRTPLDKIIEIWLPTNE